MQRRADFENPRTIFSGPEFARRYPSDPNRAIRAAREAFDASGARAVDAHRIAWSDGYDTGAFDLRDDPACYVIVGRHTNCDIVLANDPGVSLRHLFIRPTRDENGDASLDVGDLAAPLGLVPAASAPRDPASRGDGVRTAMFALGAYVVLVGSRVLARSHGIERSASMLPPRRDAAIPTPRITNISAIRSSRGGVGTLTVRTSRDSATLALRESHLAAGLLFGRYGRCIDLMLDDALPETVSRCHLLVRGEPDGVVAYDLCSSNGTYAAGRLVRRVVLRDRTRLALGSAETVLEWQSRPRS
jgi:hypothetical protein